MSDQTTTDNLTLTAPERIYLWSEHTEGRDETFNESAGWSTDNRGYTVEYVRADLVPTWRDAPTCVGWWIYQSEQLAFPQTVLIPDDGLDFYLESFSHTGKGWFGPIPDGDK